MSLQEEIDEKRKEIRTDGYSMSVGEWIALYQDGEIDIHPAFQRFFRWSDSQKSALIESILLGIPIPPIFVNQRDDGVWDVVDGVQRLSTIYEFVGILKDEGHVKQPLTLQKAKYLPSLAGKRWDDLENPDDSLTKAQRLLIKRAKISASIIQKESDSMVKYELFQRLNTGGSAATPQEVRNCTLVMLNRDFYDWMRSLANRESFKECLALSDRLYDEQYDMELLLRFIILFEIEIKNLEKLPDVGVFLSERMIEVAKVDSSLDRERADLAFKTTFDFLAETAGESSFKRFSPEKEKFLGGFLLSAYEVVALGIGYNYENLPAKDDIVRRIQEIWSNKTYKDWSGAGLTASRRLPKLIPLGRKKFTPR